MNFKPLSASTTKHWFSDRIIGSWSVIPISVIMPYSKPQSSVSRPWNSNSLLTFFYLQPDQSAGSLRLSIQQLVATSNQTQLYWVIVIFGYWVNYMDTLCVHIKNIKNHTDLHESRVSYLPSGPHPCTLWPMPHLCMYAHQTSSFAHTCYSFSSSEAGLEYTNNIQVPRRSYVVVSIIAPH